MTARQFYAATYALLVRDTVQRGGTQGDLEERLEQLATEHDMVLAHERPHREVPDSVAREQLALMSALGGPAPLKKKVTPVE